MSTPGAMQKIGTLSSNTKMTHIRYQFYVSKHYQLNLKLPIKFAKAHAYPHINLFKVRNINNILNNNICLS